MGRTRRRPPSQLRRMALRLAVATTELFQVATANAHPEDEFWAVEMEDKGTQTLLYFDELMKETIGIDAQELRRRIPSNDVALVTNDPEIPF